LLYSSPHSLVCSHFGFNLFVSMQGPSGRERGAAGRGGEDASIDVRGRVEALGQSSRMFTDSEKSEVVALAQAISKLLDAKCADMYERARTEDQPIMQVYMSDGWSTELMRSTAVHCDGVLAKRVGRFKAEFLAEKRILKTISAAGEIGMVFFLKAPRLMEAKKGWDVFDASLEEPFLRLQCENQICISVYLQDGLHAGSFLKRHRARHELHYEACLEEDVPDEVRFTRQSKDWVFGMRCVLHIGSSSVKWGLSGWLSEDILDDCHLVIKSLRNSSDPLQRHVDDFVYSVVRYEDSSEDHDSRSSFWTALGVPPAMLDFVMSVDPRFDLQANVLRVNRALEHAEGGVARVCSVVSFFLSWRNWSDTRWAGVGKSSRLLVSSLFVGIESLVAWVDRCGVNNDRFYLSASKTRLTSPVKKLLAIASLACYPADSISLALLEDDRFLMKAAELRQDMIEESEWVQQLPESFWDTVAGAIAEEGYTGRHLRSDALQAMRIAMAYLEKNMFLFVRQLPLSLTQGDIDTNLDELMKVDPKTLDYTTRKIFFCAQFFPLDCKRALRLLLDSPFSIQLVEKGHAAGAFCKRFP
jgi:hypothetical protein